jgi:hypothetical protein
VVTWATTLVPEAAMARHLAAIAAASSFSDAGRPRFPVAARLGGLVIYPDDPEPVG